jgi:microsomal dipeptidase-like Zn-dependent dipeptidase
MALRVLFDELLVQGFGEEESAKIAGGNAPRVLLEVLP